MINLKTYISVGLVVLFIALAILLLLVILFIVFYPKIKNAKLKKDYVSIYGKKIYQYALHNDLYLINELELKGNDDQKLRIDHLLFGTKYIYLITDYYLPGTVEAKVNDRSFIYTSLDKNPKKVYIDNLFLSADVLTKKVASNLGLNPNLFIPISIVDNDSDFGNLKLNVGDNYIVHFSNINKILNSLEARNVPPLNDNQLRYTVKDVNRLNERRKERK